MAIRTNGMMAACLMMVVSLSCDHRVPDGARGAQFPDSQASLVEEPLRLID